MSKNAAANLSVSIRRRLFWGRVMAARTLHISLSIARVFQFYPLPNASTLTKSFPLLTVSSHLIFGLLGRLFPITDLSLLLKVNFDSLLHVPPNAVFLF